MRFWKAISHPFLFFFTDSCYIHKEILPLFVFTFSALRTKCQILSFRLWRWFMKWVGAVQNIDMPYITQGAPIFSLLTRTAFKAVCEGFVWIMKDLCRGLSQQRSIVHHSVCFVMIQKHIIVLMKVPIVLHTSTYLLTSSAVNNEIKQRFRLNVVLCWSLYFQCGWQEQQR